MVTYVITNSTPHRTFILVLSNIVSSLFYEIQINPAIASSLLSFLSTWCIALILKPRSGQAIPED